MNLTEKEFEHLTYISAGTFGAVSHNETTAFKKYHALVKSHSDFGYQLIENPCLKPHPMKFQLMNYYSKKLQYTDLNYERLYIDKQFCGICYPYYDGKILYHLQQLPFLEKENIVRQLLRNAEELSKHHIYPLDYKLDNIIYTKQGQVKIIDLDDPLTKYKLIKHPHLFNKSMITLKNTMIHFLNVNQNHSDYFLSQHLTHAQQINSLSENITYQKLYNYLDIHRSNNSFLVINPMNFSFQNLDLIKSIIAQYQAKIIVLDCNSSELLKHFITSLIQVGIDVYDVISEESMAIDDFMNNYNTSEYFMFDKQHILKQKTKSR